MKLFPLLIRLFAFYSGFSSTGVIELRLIEISRFDFNERIQIKNEVEVNKVKKKIPDPKLDNINLKLR